MHRHLVTIEVGIECRTDQWVDLDGLAFDQLRLKGLDAQTVQGWRTVEQHRMLGDDLFKDIPDLWTYGPLDHPLGRLDVLGMRQINQALHHEGLEQLDGHVLRQATLVQLQLRARHDHRTT